MPCRLKCAVFESDFQRNSYSKSGKHCSNFHEFHQLKCWIYQIWFEDDNRFFMGHIFSSRLCDFFNKQHHILNVQAAALWISRNNHHTGRSSQRQDLHKQTLFNYSWQTRNRKHYLISFNISSFLQNFVGGVSTSTNTMELLAVKLPKKLLKMMVFIIQYVDNRHRSHGNYSL